MEIVKKNILSIICGVIAIGAVRSEGTPDGYIPKEYPAIASLDVVNALVEASTAAGASSASSEVVI